MQRFTLKMLVICFMIGFGLFFALDVATNGKGKSSPDVLQPASVAVNATVAEAASRDKANDPTDGQTAESTAEPMTAANARRLAAALAQVQRIEAEQAEEQQRQQQQQQQQRVQSLPQQTADQPAPMPVPEDSFINRLSNKIGDVLRRMAMGIIHMFVVLFRLVLG